MKISVIIPAHNEESEIAHTLKAILDQDHPDFEVIVVDNNSTDKTAEIAKSFAKDHKIPVKVVHEKNKGTMWACERGRLEAIGDIIVRIDADCLPEKNWLSKGASIFQKQISKSNEPSRKKEIVAASGPYIYHDAPLIFRGVSHVLQNYVYLLVSHIIQLPFVRRGAIMIGGNSFFRADVLEKAGGFNTEILFYGDDTEVARRMANHGKVIFSTKLPIKTSARRFKKQGTYKITTFYIFHFFKHILSRKPKQPKQK